MSDICTECTVADTKCTAADTKCVGGCASAVREQGRRGAWDTLGVASLVGTGRFISAREAMWTRYRRHTCTCTHACGVVVRVHGEAMRTHYRRHTCTCTCMHAASSSSESTERPRGLTIEGIHAHTHTTPESTERPRRRTRTRLSKDLGRLSKDIWCESPRRGHADSL